MKNGQVIVTGGSRGIGAAIVAEMSALGFQVSALSRSGTAPVGKGIACDLTDEAAVQKTFAALAKEAPIVALVNNAGVSSNMVSANLTTEEFERVMRLNATAVMIGCREAYPYLKETRGTIINIGSFFDRLGVPKNLSYCAAKAAVGAITRCLAVEWARDNITVINVAPGYIATDFNKEFLAKDSIRQWLSKRIPVGGPGLPQDVARLVGKLVSDDMRFLTGETIYMDGAQSINH